MNNSISKTQLLGAIIDYRWLPYFTANLSGRRVLPAYVIFAEIINFYRPVLNHDGTYKKNFKGDAPSLSNSYFKKRFGIGKDMVQTIISDLTKLNLISIVLQEDNHRLIYINESKFLEITYAGNPQTPCGESAYPPCGKSAYPYAGNPHIRSKGKEVSKDNTKKDILSKNENFSYNYKNKEEEISQIASTSLNTDKPIQRPKKEKKTAPQATQKPERAKKPSWVGEFWKAYPENLRGGNDAHAWKVIKNMKITEEQGVAIIQDVINRKENHERWVDGYVDGITGYLRRELWLTPVVAKKVTSKAPERAMTAWEQGEAYDRELERKRALRLKNERSRDHNK